MSGYSVLMKSHACESRNYIVNIISLPYSKMVVESSRETTAIVIL